MALIDKTAPPQPARGATPLPSRYPKIPDDVMRRFPSMKDFQRLSEDHYRKVRAALYDFQDQIGLKTSEALTETRSNTSLLRVTEGSMLAEISLERSARIDGDAALASSISSLTSTVGDNTAAILLEQSTRADADDALASSISSLTSTVNANTSNITTIMTTYATETYADAVYTAAVAASNGYADTIVSTEASARAASDGYLSGKYTLKVAAGNVVTGINITSESGPGTDISDITFVASNFKIYNGTTGVQTFSVDGFGNISIAGSITLANTQVTGLGSLATLNSVAYGDISGTKPPVNADVTLSAINGGLAITGGGLQLLSGGAAIRGGQTAYDTGLGFWLGDASGTTKFSIGNSGGNKLTWDGSALALVGSITSTSGTIGGWTIGSTFLAAGAGTSAIAAHANGSVGFIVGDYGGGASYAQLLYNAGSPTLLMLNSTSASAVSLYAAAAGGYLNLRDASNISTITLNGSNGDGTYAGTVFASLFSGSGASLTSLNATNISSGTLSNSRLSFTPGTMASQNANAVAITGGDVDGCTSDGFVYSGVTGSSRIALGWDSGNTRVGIWVDSVLKVTINQNV